MLSQLVAQLSRLMPQGAAGGRPATAVSADGHGERGWHESSWALSQGADVIELPAAAAVALFPDTQPAFHWPDEDAPLAA